MTYDAEEIENVLAGLADAEPDERAGMISMVEVKPTRDRRVIAALARLLGDESVVAFTPGSVYGELRLLSAVALAAERLAVGQIEPVRVRSRPAATCTGAASFERMRAAGELEERELAIRAPVDWDVLIVEPTSSSPTPSAARPEVVDDAAVFHEWAARLASGAVGDRVNLLQVLAKAPTGNPAVHRAVEALLADRTIARLTIPHRYGELRVLAAAALAAERHAAGDPNPVVLRAPPMLSGDELDRLAREAGIQGRTPEARYAQLRDTGAITERDHVIAYPAHLGWT